MHLYNRCRNRGSEPQQKTILLSTISLCSHSFDHLYLLPLLKLQDTLTVSLSQSKHHSITIFNWFNQSKPSTTADRSKPKTVLTPDKEAEIISEMYTFLDHNGIKREDCKLSQKYLDKHDYQRSPEAYPPAKTLKPGSAVAGVSIPKPQFYFASFTSNPAH